MRHANALVVTLHILTKLTLALLSFGPVPEPQPGGLPRIIHPSINRVDQTFEIPRGVELEIAQVQRDLLAYHRVIT